MRVSLEGTVALVTAKRANRGVVLLNINEKDHGDRCCPRHRCRPGRGCPGQVHGRGHIDVFFLPALGGHAFGCPIPYIQLQSPAQATAVGLIALEISHNGLVLAGERFLQLLQRRYRREGFFIQDLAQALIGQRNHASWAIETQMKRFEQFFCVEGKEGLRSLIARHRR